MKITVMLCLFFIFAASDIFCNKLQLVPPVKKNIVSGGAQELSCDFKVQVLSEEIRHWGLALTQFSRLVRERACALKRLKTLNSSQISQALNKCEKGSICLFELKNLPKLDKQAPELIKNPEGYYLEISDDCVKVYANSPRGLIYAAMTLRQLIYYQKEQGYLPKVIIADWPSFAIRGVSDDISRGQISRLAHFKRIIDLLAEYKINTYLLYLEDMLALTSEPLFGSYRGALSKADLMEIQDYARQYCIEVVPIFQTLGHYENLLWRKEFQRYAEYPGSTSLNPTGEEVQRFLARIVTEAISFFPESRFFHIGADESWDVGLGNSRTEVLKHGLAEVLASHYLKMIKLVLSQQKKPVIYGDMILQNQQVLKRIPKDVIIMDWQYFPNADYKSVELFKNSGFEYWVSPAIWNWRKIFPRSNFAEANIIRLNRKAAQNRAGGSIVSSWGDDGGMTFRELNYYGYVLGAASSWAPLETEAQQTKTDFTRHFFGIDNGGVVKIFNLMAELSYLSDYHNFFRHPFLPFKKINEDDSEAGYIKKAAFIERKVQELIKLIVELKPSVAKNREFFDYIEQGANQMQWFADKIKNSVELKRFMKQKSLSHLELKKIEQICEEMVLRLEHLKAVYEKLWLKDNKPENLSLVSQRFEMQKKYWLEAMQRARGNSLSEIGRELDSPWIYLDSGYGNKTKEGAVLFQKKFNLSKVSPKNYLQIIAQGAAWVVLNGQPLGEVCAQRTLSLGVEFERVKTWEVSSRLRRGENLLQVYFRSYYFKNPGINVLLEGINIESDYRLSSDRTWQARYLNYYNPQASWDYLIPSWLKEIHSKTQWRQAQEKTPPMQVSSPFFLLERKSWIEN